MNCIEDVQNRLSEGLSDLCDNEMLCWEDAICFEDDQKDAVMPTLEQQTTMEDTGPSFKNELQSPSYAISCLERMAILFMEQTVAAIPDYIIPSPQERIDQAADQAEIALEIADRTPKRSSKSKTYRFPTRSPKGARNLACLLSVMNLSHDALVSGIQTTKRDMFYKDIGLFQRQSIVDELIVDLAATFGLSRSALNVRASSKGLFVGCSMVLHLSSGQSISGSDIEPSLIPHSSDITRVEMQNDLAWVLVVEKEAVFRTLCRMGLASHPSLFGPGIIITGKGYPDFATRELLHTLSAELPQRIPILGLFDADPHGIDILSVYRFGSIAMEHENATMIAPRIQWIGVFAHELSGLGIEKEKLLPITPIDYKKALSMMHRPDHRMPKYWKTELTNMLHSRRKAEIEIICSASATVVFNEPNSGDFDDVIDLDGCDDVHLQPPSAELRTGTELLITYLLYKINACHQEHVMVE